MTTLQHLPVELLRTQGKVAALQLLEAARHRLDGLPALQRPTISDLADKDWVDVNSVLDESVVRNIIPRLKAAGARGLVEYPLNKVID